MPTSCFSYNWTVKFLLMLLGPGLASRLICFLSVNYKQEVKRNILFPPRVNLKHILIHSRIFTSWYFDVYVTACYIKPSIISVNFLNTLSSNEFQFDYLFSTFFTSLLNVWAFLVSSTNRTISIQGNEGNDWFLIRTILDGLDNLNSKRGCLVINS